MSYKPRRERRARGGKAADTQPLHLEHGHQYNAQGSPEDKEESEGPDGFKRGGRAKKKEGGHVEGHGAKHHLGKRARGGASPTSERKEEEEYAPDRKHGGHVEHDRKHGGHVEHDRAHGGHVEHEGKAHRARGGHVRGKHARGGAPFSEAHKLAPPGNDRATGPGENTESIP